MKKLLLLMFSTTLIFMFSVSAIAQQGKTVKVTNNKQLIEAYEDPTVESIKLSAGYYEYINYDALPGTILIKQKGDNGSRSDCQYIISPQVQCWDPAGTNGGTASANTNGDPTCPPANSGDWTIEAVDPSGAVLTWTNPPPTMYDEDFTVDVPGKYSLRYTWNPTTYVQADWYFFTSPSVTITVADGCVDDIPQTTVYADFDWGSYPYFGHTVTWTLNGAPITGVSDDGSFDINGEVCGSYTIAVTIKQHYLGEDGPCPDVTESEDFYLADTPIVSAGPDDETCGLTYTLQPTSSASCWKTGYPTTVWSQISGTGTATFVDNDVTVTLCGEYIFEVEIRNGLCVETAQVTIYFADSPIVDAGDDDEICFTGLPYTLTPSYTLACPNSPTTAWSKVSGPGTVTFSDNVVDFTECGPYVLRFTVTNPPCPPVDDDVNIYVYDEPVFITSPTTPIPSVICGYDTDVFYLCYSVQCPNGPPPPSDEWFLISGPPTGTATFTDEGTCLWSIQVTECGEYEFEYKVTNGECINSYFFSIIFHETPAPTIDGSTEVFACSSTDYEALDGRSPECQIGTLSYTWSISGPGDITSGMGTAFVTVDWGNSLTPSTLYVTVCVDPGSDGDGFVCCGYDDILIEKVTPILAGQVKYWNEFETYMPTPFPTNLYGTFPHDYFYVTLYEGTTCMTEIETVIVEPRLMPDLVELLSYFEFTLPIGVEEDEYDCDAVFTLRIWDGSLWYHQIPPPPPNSPTYLGASYTYNNWGGVNATDGQAIQFMAASTEIHDPPYNYTWVGLTTDAPSYGYYSYTAADVNSTDPYPYTTGGITALDALTANYRAVGLIANYPDNGSANQFSPNFRVTGRMVPSLPYMTWSTYFNYPNVDDVPFLKDNTWDYLYFTNAIDHFYASDPVPWEGDSNYINIYYLAIGDLNSSYVPTSGGFKAEPTMELIYEDQLVANQGDVLNIPISLDNEATLGALTLNLTYMNDLIEVIGTNYEKDFFNINHEEGYVRIGWFSVDAINVEANETIAILKVRVLADIEQGTRLFELDAMTELADASANRIDGINFKALGVTTDKSALIGSELTANNYPNPFTNKTTISYMLPEAGKVQVVVYSKMGQIVSTIVDQSQDAGTQTVEFNHSDLNAGVYFYKITLNGQTKYYTVTKSMVVVQ